MLQLPLTSTHAKYAEVHIGHQLDNHSLNTYNKDVKKLPFEPLTYAAETRRTFYE